MRSDFSLNTENRKPNNIIYFSVGLFSSLIELSLYFQVVGEEAIASIFFCIFWLFKRINKLNL